jgi:hypothetical protein
MVDDQPQTVGMMERGRDKTSTNLEVKVDQLDNFSAYSQNKSLGPSALDSPLPSQQSTAHRYPYNKQSHYFQHP